MAIVDHLMFAAPDLAAGVRHIKALSGIEAAPGGAHPGNGTRNALMSLGPGQYLEIIAPDPAQAPADNLAADILSRDRMEIRAWAVAAKSGETERLARSASLGTRRVPMSRTTPDGVRLEWEIVFVTGHPFGDAFPFFIDWLASPHPSGTTPGGCTLSSLEISVPGAADYRKLIATFGIEGVDVVEGAASLNAVLVTPNGQVTI
ncbi:MAG: VOC family protein [Pseudomonadales bacterium]|nr:VOC family protein [Pseudomonadales bacterium]